MVFQWLDLLFEKSSQAKRDLYPTGIWAYSSKTISAVYVYIGCQYKWLGMVIYRHIEPLLHL